MSESASAPGIRDITAAILAGGLGTRLSSVVSDRPKALAPIRGRPFLAYLLDQLADAGIQTITICTGHGAAQIEAEFGDTFRGARIRYSRETSPLGTGGALRLALPKLDSSFVLVLNGDSFAEVDLDAFWTWHLTRKATVSLALAQVTDARRYGSVQADEAGRIRGFVEKSKNAGPGLINAGAYLLARQIIADIPPERSLSMEREIFPGLVGHGLYGWAGCRRFIDIGTPESYSAASDFFS
jgi:NDP-sugar pyrophosphorylase family protein